MKIGYIVGTYPLVTTTFIDREIKGLREQGIDITILSIRRPPKEVGQIEEYRAMQQGILYLFPIDWIRLVLAHLYLVLTRPLTYWSLFGYLVSRHHPNLRLRITTALHFGEGVYAAYLLRNASCDRLHAHFVDRAATVALCVSRLLDKPYSVTAHANDLYANPVLLFEKIGNAQFAVTVSQFNKEHLLRNYPELDPDRISVLHPWVTLEEFQPPTLRIQNRRFRILSVGRLVEKKGHRYLVEACRLLRDQGVHIECRILGGGPLENELVDLVNARGMADCVHLEGSRSKADVLESLAEADVFVLASVIAKDGDRDGMPVALAEAMAMQVPVVSTNIVGISELVRPGAGILVPPQDPDALAHAIKSICMMNSKERAEMGMCEREIIKQDFQVNKQIEILANKFRQEEVLPLENSQSDKERKRENGFLGMPSVFIVWGPPSVGPRSSVLARELGIGGPHFVQAGNRGSAFSALFRYLWQGIQTLWVLVQDRPRVVFVQSPPSLAVLVVYLYCGMMAAKYVVDAHSAALLQRVWMWPRWLHRMLVRHAVATIVTNDEFAAQIQAEGGRSFVLRDVPTHFDSSAEYPLPKTFKIAIVNTFQEDEPLDEILAAAKELPEIDFFITGDTRRARPDVLSRAPANAHFTGFIPKSSYYALLGAADAVMCLTTRDNTMQRGACEALSLGRPIITSDTRLLRDYFHLGAVHVTSTTEDIRNGVLKIRSDLSRYQSEILDLQIEQRAEWNEKRRALEALIRQAFSIPEGEVNLAHAPVQITSGIRSKVLK